MNTIEEFNTNLANKLIKYDLNVYFNTVHYKYYSNVDISFMDYFLSLIPKKNEFYVDHIKLQEYGVINTNNKSSDILRALNQFNLEEGIDYQVRNVAQRLPSGTKYAKKYKLTPYAFKLCLIRAKNSKKYANYYLMLEEIFYYYKEYQNQFHQVIINNISKENKTLNEKIEELLHYAKDTKEELDDLNYKFDDLNEKVDDIKDAFEETAGRSVPDPINDCDKSEFVLLQSKILPNEFSFMRGIQSYNDVNLNKKYSANYNIIKREYNANPVQLFRTLKEIVKEQYKLEKSIIQAN